jgi:hypothetical protein
MTLDNIKRINLINYARAELGLQCDDKGMAHCPFHPPDKNPSFSIYQDKDGEWRWKDFHDDQAGTIVDLAARLSGITAQAAIAELLQEYGFNHSPSIEKSILRSHIYRNRDGIEIAKKVKYADGRWAYFHKDAGAWVPGKGSAPALPYYLEKFENRTFVVICEGEKDAEIVMRVSDEAILATSAPNGKASWPDELTPHFTQFSGMMFLYDVGNEEDARKHAHKLHVACPSAQIKIARVPLDEIEADITDYLETFEGVSKAEALFKVLDGAKSIDFDTSQPQRATVAGQTPILTDLSSVEIEKLQWLWEQRFPLGKLSIIAGQPGQGKSFFSLFMAAQVTTGGIWPDDSRSPAKGSVIILSAEDGVADTIKPRALAMGADTTKIRILDGVETEKRGRESFDLSKHMLGLRKAVHDLGDTRLIIIDPISAYMGSVNCHTNSEVRKCMHPLVTLAEECRVAVICISHLNKAEGFSAMSRVMDSTAFIATARAVWLIGADPQDSSGERKLLALLKSNLFGRTKGLAFRIVEDRLAFESNEVDIDANSLLVPGGVGIASSVDRAKKMLSGLLVNGPVPSEEIYQRAKEEHIPANALNRARKELGIRVQKEGFGESGRWVWELPSKDHHQAVDMGIQG